MVAELRSARADCSSACVYALVGATQREIPPGVYLGIHASEPLRRTADGKLEPLPMQSSRQKEISAHFTAELREYVRRVGGNVSLVDAAANVPNLEMRPLTREEIYLYGIDRRERSETGWVIYQNGRFVKMILDKRYGGDGEFRTNAIELQCGVKDKAMMVFYAGLANSEKSRPDLFRRQARITMRAAEAEIVLPNYGSVSPIPAFDPATDFDTRTALVPFEFYENAVRAGSLDVIESHETPSAAGKVRTQKFSAEGLRRVIDELKRSCG